VEESLELSGLRASSTSVSIREEEHGGEHDSGCCDDVRASTPIVVTLGGRRYLQQIPNVVALDAENVQVNDMEFRFYVIEIVRRGKKISSLLTLGTLLCFLSVYFGYIDKRAGKSWVLFVAAVFFLGIVAQCLVVTLNGCDIPREEHINKCMADVSFLIVFLFAFISLVVEKHK